MPGIKSEEALKLASGATAGEFRKVMGIKKQESLVPDMAAGEPSVAGWVAGKLFGHNR